MSCKCQGCGDQYNYDLIVPDDLWEIIKPPNKPEGAGLLCGICIAKRLESLSGSDKLLPCGEKVCKWPSDNYSCDHCTLSKEED